MGQAVRSVIYRLIQAEICYYKIGTILSNHSALVSDLVRFFHIVTTHHLLAVIWCNGYWPLSGLLYSAYNV